MASTLWAGPTGFECTANNSGTPGTPNVAANRWDSQPVYAQYPSPWRDHNSEP